MLHAAQDNLMAVLAMQRAAELEPGCAEFAEDLERLHRRIPFEHAELLQARLWPARLHHWFLRRQLRKAILCCCSHP